MNKLKNIPQKDGIMKVIAKSIVKYRFFIMAVFLAAALYCGMSISKVKVNEDITAFLPEDTETRQGLTVMEDEFITYGTADIRRWRFSFFSTRLYYHTRLGPSSPESNLP